MKWVQDCFSHTQYGQDLLAIETAKTIAIAFRQDGLFVIQTQGIRKREVDYIVAMQAVASEGPQDCHGA